MRGGQQGQVLPLFVLVLVVLLGMAAIGIDVASAYSARQAYRTAADAASLAGAQNLQAASDRSVGLEERTKARSDALASLVKTLHATGTGGCAPETDVDNCELAGTPFRISIRTPLDAESCVSCDPSRSIQVTVANPEFSLSFGRALGADHWNISVSAVAGLIFGGQYALIALRPPGESEGDNPLANIRIGEHTTLDVGVGDIGTNRSLVSSGAVSLASGFSIYHFDAATPWDPPPPERHLTSLIKDPEFPFPSSANTPAPYTTLSRARDTEAACQAIVTPWLLPDSGYEDFVPMDGTDPKMSRIDCYKPGVYDVRLSGDEDDSLTVLEPGVYFFNQGIELNGNLIGGYLPDSEGVAIVLPQDEAFQDEHHGHIALNAGAALARPPGHEATAARTSDHDPVVTNTTPPVPMTLVVQRDPACTVTEPYPTACDDGDNKTIRLDDVRSLYLAGVQYAPSDNVVLGGENSAANYVGQLVAWTVRYSGEATFNQKFLGNVAGGLVRLDGACTAPGTPCDP